MLRFALTLCLSLFTYASGFAPALAQSWVTLATFEIDAREAGSRSIAIGPSRGQFTAIRLQASGPVTLSRAEVRPVDDAAQSRAGPLGLAPDRPAVVWTGARARAIATVSFTWGVEAAPGKVKITIQGVPGQDVAGQDPSGGGQSDGASQERRPAARSGEIGSAAPRSMPQASTGTRGIAAPPSAPSPAPSSPPPPPSAGAPRPAPPVVASAPPGGPGVCVDRGVCTLVNVFFGTDRKKVATPERIRFSGEPASQLALGRGFVTVPKTRARGELPRPGWVDIFRRLPPEGDPARHFTIPKNGVKVYAGEADFLADVRRHVAEAGAFKDHAFVYIHGFGVSFDDALYRAAQISYDLSTDGNPFGTAFVYSWPSLGSILPTAYIADQDSADSAVPHLRAFLEMVTERTGVKNVHIIAHSMGNRVLMRTLEQIVLSGGKANINQVVLAAPDVDKRQFETIAQNVAKLAKGTTLYASTTDKAMRISRDARQGVPRAGDANVPPGPAIVAGIDTIDISSLSSAVFAYFDVGHDRYADSPELLSDIANLFKSGVRPPERRNTRFLLLREGSLAYWRYK